jgi:glycosyltransferase involved in cell wall biosynthesis
MSDDVRISVALVTRNRPDSLRRCLESLRRQETPPFEVVISDDSDSGFASKNAELAHEFECRYFLGPRRGLYANRNAAAVACAGTHVRTMDDDHTFPPGHFSACAASVRSNPARIWSTGEIAYVDGKYTGTSERANQLDPSGVGIIAPEPDDHWAIADGSTIYPKAVFDAGHRMVERWSYGSAYLEFGAYLYARGWRGASIPGALVEHHLEASALVRCTPEPTLFASVCHNCYFRPDSFRLMRTIARHAVIPGRTWVAPAKVADIWKLAADRWKRD